MKLFYISCLILYGYTSASPGHERPMPTQQQQQQQRFGKQPALIIPNNIAQHNSTTDTIIQNTEKTTETTEEIRKKVFDLMKDERILDAVTQIEKINPTELTEEEKEMMKIAKEAKEFVDRMNAGPDSSWVQLGESIRKNNRIQELSFSLKYGPVRSDLVICSPVEKSLAMYLVAVLNEIGMYHTWMPNWSTPKFEVRRAEVCEKRKGRFSQTLVLCAESPLRTVEFYIDSQIVDDTESNKCFALYLGEVEAGAHNGLVPPVDPEGKDGVTRVTVSGGMMLGECPKDLAERAAKLRKKGDKNDPDDEEYLTLKLTIVYQNRDNFVEPNFLVKKFGNFVAGVVLSAIWGKLVTVAEEIRDGKRPDFTKRIEERKEIYDWALSRIERITSESDETETDTFAT